MDEVMSLGDEMAKQYAEEDALREQWALGDYISTPCPNCGRIRLCKCDNGKHRCEKCNWVPEDRSYCPLT